MKGDPISSLDLGNWGTYSLRTNVAVLLWGFKCQWFGHHQASCKAKMKCDIYSKLHNTEVCLMTYKEGHVDNTPKCPDCGKQHHARHMRKEAVFNRQEPRSPWHLCLGI